MLITDLKGYWEACYDYHRRGATTLLNTQYVLEKNERIRVLVGAVLDRANEKRKRKST